MKIFFSTILILILKVTVFTLTLFFAKDRPVVIIFVICSVFFYIRCMIFKENENEPINFVNHGDFLSEFPSLAFFYFFQPDFKTALYFHLGFGSIHYLQYVFGFILPTSLELIWEAIKAIFRRLISKPKKDIPRTAPQVLRPQLISPPEPPPTKTKIIMDEEEIPIPIIEGPKKRPSIYDI